MAMANPGTAYIERGLDQITYLCVVVTMYQTRKKQQMKFKD